MTEKGEKSGGSYYKLLKNTHFLFYSLTEFFTRFGMGLTSIGLILLAFGDMGSILNVSYMKIAGDIPVLFLGLAAGAYVDRIGKKKSYLISAFVSSIIVLIPIFYRDLYILILIVGFKTIFSNFKSSAHNGILPLILNKKELMKANSFLRTIMNGAAIIAPTAAVLIIYSYGYFWLFILDSITYILDGMCMYFIPVEEESKEDTENGILSVFEDIKKAYYHIKDRKKVVFLILSGSVLTILAVGYGLYVLKLIDMIFSTRMFYGYYQSAAAFGALIGGIITGKYLDGLSYEKLISISSVLLSVSFIGIALIPVNIAFIIFPFIFSFAISIKGISINTGIQSLCDQKFLGRISSLTSFSMILGSLIAVPLALGIITFLGVFYGMFMVGFIFLLFPTILYLF